MPEIAERLFHLVLQSASLGNRLEETLRGLPLPPALVLGGGKAGRAMADAVSKAFPHALGAVAVPPEHADSNRPIRLLPAGHPLPTVESIAAVEAQERLAAETKGPILFLLSGGATAMLGAPLPGLSLEDLRSGYGDLLRSGLPVQEMNLVRRHLTRWGGGKLASILRRPVTVLVVSDVLDDDLRSIGSGPLYPDATSYRDAWNCLAAKSLSESPIGRFCSEGARGLHPETVRPGSPELDPIEHKIVLSNRTVVEAVRNSLSGLNVQVVETETGPVAAAAANWSRRLRTGGEPCIFIAGGEPTVQVHGQGGAGGRNQHLVLQTGLEAKDAADWLFMSVATDGVDGYSQAAGGWITPAIVRNHREAIVQGLGTFSSGDVAAELGIAFQSGPTGSNVADVQIGIAGLSRLALDKIPKVTAP